VYSLAPGAGPSLLAWQQRAPNGRWRRHHQQTASSQSAGGARTLDGPSMQAIVADAQLGSLARPLARLPLSLRARRS